MFCVCLILPRTSSPYQQQNDLSQATKSSCQSANKGIQTSVSLCQRIREQHTTTITITTHTFSMEFIAAWKSKNTKIFWSKNLVLGFCCCFFCVLNRICHFLFQVFLYFVVTIKSSLKIPNVIKTATKQTKPIK